MSHFDNPYLPSPDFNDNGLPFRPISKSLYAILNLYNCLVEFFMRISFTTADAPGFIARCILDGDTETPISLNAESGISGVERGLFKLSWPNKVKLLKNIIKVDSNFIIRILNNKLCKSNKKT